MNCRFLIRKLMRIILTRTDEQCLRQVPLDEFSSHITHTPLKMLMRSMMPLTSAAFLMCHERYKKLHGLEDDEEDGVVDLVEGGLMGLSDTINDANTSEQERVGSGVLSEEVEEDGEVKEEEVGLDDVQEEELSTTTRRLTIRDGDGLLISRNPLSVTRRRLSTGRGLEGGEEELQGGVRRRK